MKTSALFIALFGSFFAAVSQYLLKLSANKTYSKPIYNYLNFYVISGYAILFAITIANLYTLRYLPLYMLPMIEATSFIHVAIISSVFLKEKQSRRKLIGLVMIIAGVILASI